MCFHFQNFMMGTIFSKLIIDRYFSLSLLQKVYIFLWFWFILLSVLSFLVIVYRIIIVISPKMRAYLLYIRFRLIRREVINTIVKKSYVGDWFLFYMLGNITSNLKNYVKLRVFRLGFLGGFLKKPCKYHWMNS